MKEAKKQALIEFHRSTIQSAAEKLFSVNGVEATSLDEIAKNAGYSKATLYVYFKDKADIWNNVLLSAMKTMKEKIADSVSTDQEVMEKYFALCDAITDFAEEHPLYFESLLGFIPLENEETSLKIFQVGEEINEIIGRFISQGIEEKIFRADVRFPDIVMILWACISGVIRMSNQKETYLSEATGRDKKEFLRYGFETLLRSITH